MTAIAVIAGLVALVWGAAFVLRGSLLGGCLTYLALTCCFSSYFFSFDVGGVTLSIDRLFLVALVGAWFVQWRLGNVDLKPLGKIDILWKQIVLAAREGLQLRDPDPSGIGIEIRLIADRNRIQIDPVVRTRPGLERIVKAQERSAPIAIDAAGAIGPVDRIAAGCRLVKLKGAELSDLRPCRGLFGNNRRRKQKRKRDQHAARAGDPAEDGTRNKSDHRTHPLLIRPCAASVTAPGTDASKKERRPPQGEDRSVRLGARISW